MFGRFVLMALTTGLLAGLSFSDSESDGYRIYVGTGSGDAEEGIYAFRFDTTTGAFTFEHETTGVLNPSYLNLSPDQQFLYTVASVEGQPEGAVNAYRVDSETGELTFINQQSTLGRGPCYVAVDRTGRWVMAANYSSGNVVLFPVREDGGLEAASDTAQHVGSSVDAERQEGPHAHFINVGPDNRFVFAADLGTDKVYTYTIDEDEGQLIPHDSPWTTLTPGSGPRHLDFHPNGRFLYVLNELNGTVSAFSWDPEQGQAAELQTISTLPEDFDGYNKSADIHVHPSGRFLYASNRGDFDSIAVFAIDSETGELTSVQHQQQSIVWPRNFALDPTGRFLLVANRNDNSMASFRIDSTTGQLTATGHKAEVPEPVCIKFQSGKPAGF